MTARVTALPGVAAAAFVNFPPLVFKGGRALIAAEGQADPAPQEISRDMAIDRVAGPGAERWWPDQDPIGRRLKFGPASAPGVWLTVVGVVGDVREMALESRVEPEVYMPSNQGQSVPPFLWPQYLVVRTAGDPRVGVASVRQAVWSVDAQQAVANIRTMEDVFDLELQSRSTQLTLVGAFALLAVVMAGIGLYGVLACTVAQRLPEIGVRVALGAARSRVVFDTLRGAMAMAGVGIALGLVVALAISRGLQAWLFEVSPLDAATFAGTGLLLALMALLASAVPAARGASGDPVRVLRSE